MPSELTSHGELSLTGDEGAAAYRHRGHDLVSTSRGRIKGHRNIIPSPQLKPSAPLSWGLNPGTGIVTTGCPQAIEGHTFTQLLISGDPAGNPTEHHTPQDSATRLTTAAQPDEASKQSQRCPQSQRRPHIGVHHHRRLQGNCVGGSGGVAMAAPVPHPIMLPWSLFALRPPSYLGPAFSAAAEAAGFSAHFRQGMKKGFYPCPKPLFHVPLLPPMTMMQSALWTDRENDGARGSGVVPSNSQSNGKAASVQGTSSASAAMQHVMPWNCSRHAAMMKAPTFHTEEDARNGDCGGGAALKPEKRSRASTFNGNADSSDPKRLRPGGKDDVPWAPCDSGLASDDELRQVVNDDLEDLVTVLPDEGFITDEVSSE